MISGTTRPHGIPRDVALAGGFVVTITGLVVLVGWAAGWVSLVRVSAGHPTMPVNTALCLVTVGAAVALGASGLSRAASSLGAVALVLPALALAQLALGTDLGVDSWLLSDTQRRLEPELVSPGRMSAATAVAVLALALGLVVHRRWAHVAHGLALLAATIGYVSFVGYLYGADVFHRNDGASSVGEHTATLLVVTGVGLLCLRPDVGLPALLAESGVIGSLLRQFAAFAAVAPILVGGVRWLGQRAEWYDSAFGLAIVTLAWTVGLLAMIWMGGRSALPVERERDAALDRALDARDRLALMADASSVFASTLDIDEVLERVTSRVVDTLADGCSVRLIDPTGEHLLPLTVHHRDPGRRGLLATLLGHSSRTDEGIAGRCLDTRRPVLLANFSPGLIGPLGIPDLALGLERAGFRSLIVAPLIAQERPLGILAVLRDQNETPFGTRDVELVEDLAARAAQAIDQADMVARQRRSDAALTEFGRRALVADDSAALCQHAVDLLNVTLAARYALLMTAGSDGRLSVAAVAGPEGESVALNRGSPVTAAAPMAVLATGDSIVCDDMRHEPVQGMVEMGELLAADSSMAVPVPGDPRPLGVLTVAALGIGRFAEDDLAFVRALAALLAAALDRLAAQQSVLAVAEERRALLDRLVTAQEDERARIADGVHEDQVQVIAAVDMRLGLLARRVEGREPDLADDVAFAQEAVSGVAVRLRDLLFDLQSPDEGVDLADALRIAAAHLFERPGTRWEVLSDSTAGLSASHLTTAYRIAKQALSNVNRHARAAAVEVRVTDADGGVLVSVHDNGVGMAMVPDRSPTGHRGISSMRDTAAVAGGWLGMVSSPGHGTTVRFWIPSDL